jgi:hypothetical protein
MNGDKLAGIAVGLESEGGVRQRLGEINLSKNIPGLAGISGSVPRDAFFESCHDTSSSSKSRRRYLRRSICQACLTDALISLGLAGADFLQKLEV